MSRRFAHITPSSPRPRVLLVDDHRQFLDAVSAMLPSIVEGGATLRRLAFPPIMIPLSASVAIGITFCVNVSAFAVFAAIQSVQPRIEWLLVPPLLAELYLFTVSLGLLLSALYVRFRDIGQIWELAAQLLFFASAIFYPIGILPDWAQKVAFLNPFVQVMQDIRHAVLGGARGPNDLTAASVFASAGGRLVPISIVALVLVAALVFFRREGRYFADYLFKSTVAATIIVNMMAAKVLKSRQRPSRHPQKASSGADKVRRA